MGRPRSFDPDKALDRAMHLFWRKGYEGTSLVDLTHAMRINAPSLYAAFGNKEALFRKAIDRYIAGPGKYFPKAIAAPTARGVVERIFDGVIKLQTAKGNPGGCMIVHGAISGDRGSGTRNIATGLLAAVESEVRKRLERSRAEGDLPQDANPADLARYVVITISGIAVAGATGASRKQLQRTAQIALKAWPS